MIKKIITGLIFTVILSTGALASDELYVKDDGCFVTKTLGIMDYLSLIYSQGDFEALSKALISGCNNGTILRMNSGKKCFLIKIKSKLLMELLVYR